MDKNPARVEPGYRLPPDDTTLLSECNVTYFRSSGPGGQHKNKTYTAVRLQHRPTGIVCIGKRSRSQSQNRVDALRRLRERITALLTPKKKRRPTKTPAHVRQQRLEEKRRRGKIKELRGKLKPED